MFQHFYLLLCISFTIGDAQVLPPMTMHVGVAAVQNVQTDMLGWSVSGGAVGMAVDYVKQQQILPDIDFTFEVVYTECDPIAAMGAAIKFMQNESIDVVIGPLCPQGAFQLAHLSTYYNKTMLGWGLLIQDDFTDMIRFPYTTTITATSYSLALATKQLLEQFEFTRISLLYYANAIGLCGTVVSDLDRALSTSDTVNIVYRQAIYPNRTDNMKTVLTKVKSLSRIVVMCFDSSDARRDMFVTASSLGMLSEEYLYLQISLRSQGFVTNGLTPFWENTDINVTDGHDSLLKNASNRMMVSSVVQLDLNSDVLDVDYMARFKREVIHRITLPPISCQTPACLAADENRRNVKPGTYSRQLHDVFVMWALAMNQTIRENPSNLRNAAVINANLQGTFQGLTGEVTINANNTREPLYNLYGLKNFDQISFMNITFNGDTIITSNDVQLSGIWARWGGKKPLSLPICGYSGKECPRDFFDQYFIYVIVGAVVLVLMVIAIILFIIFLVRSKNREQRRLNAEWQIPFNTIREPDMKKSHQMSSKSLGSSSTGTTSSKRSDVAFEGFEVMQIDKNLVLGNKYHHAKLGPADCEQFVKMRKLDNENVNRFIGLSIDGTHFISVWRYCKRSSIQDIISRGSLSIDPFFMYCIIRDIAQGLSYLHHSFLALHGCLTSGICLVNEGWQVKLSGFGMSRLSPQDPYPKRLLWVAPEHLREAGSESVEGDMYSFAIVCSEIVSRHPPWNLGERTETLDEIVYLVKKGGNNPIRPDIGGEDLTLNQALFHMIRDCWSEQPSQRLSSDAVLMVLKSIIPNKSANLFDHVFSVLEEYTSSLEDEVAERTKELTIEKKKADLLLSKMLPPQVAERLKLGQAVEPESFESATVFFCDVVKFTQMAAKCSPFQVVTLLNDIYTSFDSIIEDHGVYKVESIGDGYLCVSGIPTRNGHAHIKVTVEMSLKFMEYVSGYRIQWLPKERLQLRIGLNTGPAVAGVVGLSMPRYCLFGDTVNTASRMESNGKPGRIHMTSAAHSLLKKEYPGEYATESRGDVIIKGKGVMETFFVISRTNDRTIGNSAGTKNSISSSENIRPHESTPDLTKQEIPGDNLNQKRNSTNSIIISTESDAMYRKFVRSDTELAKE